MVVRAMKGCNENLEEEFYRLLKEGRERIGGRRSVSGSMLES
jgi:hypothetical protein